MADEPRFPAPEEAKTGRAAYRSASVRGSVPEEPEDRRIVVARAEPPPDSREPVKLSAVETRALLELGGGSRDTAWTRGRIVFIPIGLFLGAAKLFFGSAAPFVMFGAAIVALVWIARPLFRRDGW